MTLAVPSSGSLVELFMGLVSLKKFGSGQLLDGRLGLGGGERGDPQSHEHHGGEQQGERLVGLGHLLNSDMVDIDNQ